MNKVMLVTGVALVALLAAHIHAADGGKTCPSAKTPSQSVSYVTARYSVPSLTKKSGKLLARAAAKQAGLVSAKPDLKEKTFSVVFETGKTSSADILAALKTKAPDATLSYEGPIERKATASACESCPGSKSCPSAKRADSAGEESDQL